MKLSTDEMAELLMLARQCTPLEFMRLMEALGRSLRVPRPSLDETVRKFEKAWQREKKSLPFDITFDTT